MNRERQRTRAAHQSYTTSQYRSVCTVYFSEEVYFTLCPCVLLCVQKAIYCPGVPAIGAESVNFSIECTDCADYDTTFQFRVYSESFSKFRIHRHLVSDFISVCAWCQNMPLNGTHWVLLKHTSQTADYIHVHVAVINTNRSVLEPIFGPNTLSPYKLQCAILDACLPTDTTQEQWCEGVDTTVPSEVVHTHKPPPNVPSLSRPTEEGEEESAVSGENRTNAENYENTKDDNNNSGAIATVPAFVLSISVVILAGLLQ